MHYVLLILLCITSTLWAVPNPQAYNRTYTDLVHINGDKVYVIPEYWNRFRKSGAKRPPRSAKRFTGSRGAFRPYVYNEALLIGAYDAADYYVIISHRRRISVRALRVQCSILYTAGWSVRERSRVINALIHKLAVPYQFDKHHNHIGLFFDGTAAFKEETHTNIFKDFTAYTGNKSYYAGIGNFKDNNFWGILAGATWADPSQQFFPIIRQAYRDLLYVCSRRPNETMYVDMFGMSRGAAQAVELARLLQQKPIPGLIVNFLGLYEPVYSVGFLRPGQQSLLVESGDIHGNWTRGNIPSNVIQAAIVYARNEERTWFSAAYFSYDPTKTIVDIGVLSGSHGSICGPRVQSSWQPCLHIMARSWMRERARLACVPCRHKDVLHPICNDIACALTTAIAEVLQWDYDDFGAGRIQSQQGINVQWLANRLLPWQWGAPAPIKNRYKRDFTPLLAGCFKPSVLY